MSGGSIQPETQQDQQCTHCLLYYSSRGIHNHEDTCIFADVDLDDYAEHVREHGHGAEPSPSADGDAVESASHDVNPGDGVDTGTSVEDVPDTAASADADAARTDGAGLGLDGPPEAADDGGDLDDDRDELECIGCGESLGVTDEELREKHGDAAVLTCECGKRMRWSA